ncbi:hypothetical protein Trydic_g18651 [Trypoxylus dichotomus]
MPPKSKSSRLRWDAFTRRRRSLTCDADTSVRTSTRMDVINCTHIVRHTCLGKRAEQPHQASAVETNVRERRKMYDPRIEEATRLRKNEANDS